MTSENNKYEMTLEFSKNDIKNIESKLFDIIDKKDWEINLPNGKLYDVFSNFVTNLLKLCYAYGYIYYYDSDRKSAIQSEATFPGCPTVPSDNAVFALFNLRINVPRKGIFYCLFERNTNKIGGQNEWIFKGLNSTYKCDEWYNILNDLRNVSDFWKQAEKKIKPKPINIEENSYDIPYYINHFFNNNCSRLERFLPNKVRSILKDYNDDNNNEAVKLIVEEFICWNIKSIKEDEKIISWNVKDLLKASEECNEITLSQLNYLYPFRFNEVICGAMVIRTTSNNNEPILKTILDLKQAYVGAKLYNPNFRSEWLTIDNVNKAIKLGCIENLNF